MSQNKNAMVKKNSGKLVAMRFWIAERKSILDIVYEETAEALKERAEAVGYKVRYYPLKAKQTYKKDPQSKWKLAYAMISYAEKHPVTA